MKRKRVSDRWQPEEPPHKSEIPAVRVQRNLAYLSSGCSVLIAVCVYLWSRGFPMIPVAAIAFVVLCASVLAHIVSVFRNGFFARGGYVARGGYGIFLALLRLGGILLLGMFFLWLMICN